jgi:hypothetical protein
VEETAQMAQWGPKSSWVAGWVRPKRRSERQAQAQAQGAVHFLDGASCCSVSAEIDSWRPMCLSTENYRH